MKKVEKYMTKWEELTFFYGEIFYRKLNLITEDIPLKHYLKKDAVVKNRETLIS